MEATMTLNVKSREIEGVVVIDLAGRITCGDPQMLLRETIRLLVDAGRTRLVLNLSEVSFVDSSGLSELVSCWHLLTAHGGKVNLLGLKKRVNDLLVITKLVVVFDSFEQESKAVAALQPTKLRV
jgi:anti-sigma B factor antagonist